MVSDFDSLQPDEILAAVEKAGYVPTGEYSQLNSYENRVFDIRLETSPRAPQPVDRIIAKFYRPRRWSRAAIQDEHDFLNDLVREGIPAIAPFQGRDGETILQHGEFLGTIFPRVLGRMPQEFLAGELKQVGRTLARIHNVGARHAAKHRPTLGSQSFGWDVLPRLERFVYPEFWSRYQDAAEVIFNCLEDELNPSEFVRIHGDCHKGNLLHTGNEFFFVDFDDCCNGPVVQDFWMLLSGAIESDKDAELEQEQICLGYEELRDLPDQWHLFEPLRGLRIIYYAAWIAHRWNDPFFKRIFPTFETYSYWADEIRRLETIAADL